MTDPSFGSIELYQSSDGSVSIDVRTRNDTVWATQQRMATLFSRDPTTIERHVRNVLREELAGLATTADFAVVRNEGGRLVERKVEYFNPSPWAQQLLERIQVEH